jgi:hypothetical protein
LGTYKIQGKDYDLDDLTLDEMGEIEEIAGKPYSELTFGSVKEIKAIVLVLMKRDQPELTIEEIGSIKMVEFVQPEEKLPPLPPGEADSPQNGSVRDDSGIRPSVASIPG